MDAKCIGTLLPGVADHVVESKAVWLERIDRRGSGKPVGGGILRWNVPCRILHGSTVVSSGSLSPQGKRPAVIAVQDHGHQTGQIGMDVSRLTRETSKVIF
jgi:hypothetical protein